MRSHYTVPNCSMARTMGLPEVDGLRPCEPLDVIKRRGRVANLTNFPVECMADCNRTSFM